MAKAKLNNIQDIHYLRQKPTFWLNLGLSISEKFYSAAINFKNFLYRKNILKEQNVEAFVICVGNLTTGGVGKTPIVANLANKLANEKKTPIAIISRGYGAKIKSSEPIIIKDLKGIRFKNGELCGDEPYQLATKVAKNVVVITCPDRKKSSDLAIYKFGARDIIMDDGFSNRKIKKDKTIIVIDSKMRFGNNHLLPKGPLREPVKELRRADEIILVDKGDENLNEAIEWIKTFKKPTKICSMKPNKIYNAKTRANVIFNKPLNTKVDENYKPKAVAFCAIGQPIQFFDFAKEYYEIVETVAFDDHHKYDKNDINRLLMIADTVDTNIFITTQKDETKLTSLIQDVSSYSFNVLELKEEITEIN